jgi:RES domain-containing protein
MRCYRIMSETYYKNPYSTSGNAGRWNPKGIRMMYAASAPAVALLEYLCIKGSTVGTKSWYMITFEIADESLIASLDPSNLPPDWAEIPHSKNTQDFGKIWLASRDEPFLKVPSSRINIAFYPLEFNLLINPDFPDLQNLLKVVDTHSFNYLLNKS